MVGDKSNQLLGELLTEARLIELDDLREAAHIARSQNLPIGKVLVMSGYMSKELLRAAVEVQSRLKDNLLDYDLGLKALVLVSNTNCSLEEALSQLGIRLAPIANSTTYRLGALLLGASLISESDYDTALTESQRCGLPLGRVLANLSVLSEETIDSAIEIQKMLRAGEISKEQAVQFLIERKESKLKEQDLTVNSTAENKAVENEVPVEKTLSDAIFEEKDKVNKVNKVNKDIKLFSATDEIQEKKEAGVFPTLNSLTLHHMLLMAGLVQTDVLNNAIRDCLKNPEIMALILKRSAILEDFVIDAAQECCQLIASGKLKPEQAIIALHHCQRTRNSIDECLAEFGWAQKSEIIW